MALYKVNVYSNCLRPSQFVVLSSFSGLKQLGIFCAAEVFTPAFLRALFLASVTAPAWTLLFVT
jgi:hypothetical protein